LIDQTKHSNPQIDDQSFQWFKAVDNLLSIDMTTQIVVKSPQRDGASIKARGD